MRPTITLACILKNEENQEKEEWRDIPDFYGYQASSLGRIRSVRTFNKKTKTFIRKKTIDVEGYESIGLYKNGKLCTRKVNRLVLKAFSCCPGEHYHAAHINNVRHDNRVENLIWQTPKENMNYKKLFGTSGVGEKNSNAKLTEMQVATIIKKLKNGVLRSELAKEYNVSWTQVDYILKNKSWTHLERA